ncbi:MAG: AraC family transcriptional regulator [Panacagrimonas sp.]|jgi:transcriptional regulator GlxA family with amidase domain|nr:GlxA family transcriptional regulator [Panacagrimonas sp.]MCC2654948.1 AraC family transcriptional regulator [Panacagrimonas sp.]
MSPASTRSVAFLVTPAFVLLDMSGALEAFHLAHRLRPDSYRLRVMSLDGGPIESTAGVAVATERATQESFDTLFVIGGERSLYGVPSDQIAYLRAVAPGVRRVASVCVGAYILAAAGLLDDRRATTHWMWAKEMQDRYPQVRVDGDRIFTCDEGIWTSAGVTAGIDLALALIEDDLGKDVARSVARLMVVYHRRAGGQMQFSSLLKLDPDSDRIRRVLSYVREHLDDPLPVEKLAEIAHLSVRQFGRAFSQATGTTPAKVVERLRVEAARPRIQDGREPLESIARSVGFSDADRMRLSFRRVFGQTPQTLRRDARI